MCVTNLEIKLEEDPKLLVNGMEVGDPLISHVSVNSGESDLNSEFLQEQIKDPHLSSLRDWLKDQTAPDESIIMVWGPHEKALWMNRDNFYLKGEVLWKKGEPNDRIVVPQSLQKCILSLNHDLPLTGHAAVDRTLAKLNMKYYWHGMTVDVQAYIANCAICNRNKKTGRKGRHPMIVYHAGVPMEQIHLDFLGPLPKTQQGNEYILVIVDQFTKWVECIPLPSQTAEVTARAAVNEFFCRFGCPLQIFTDQGCNFESNLFVQMCKLLNIHKAKTTYAL